MPSTNTYRYAAFGISLVAYVPLLIGGWRQPGDMNLSCFLIWIVLAGMATYSAKKEKMVGWMLMLGYFIGNIATVFLMLLRGGYVDVLTLREYLALGTIIGTFVVWGASGLMTGRWNARHLYWGSIIADAVSFYPVVKQFALPHERPSAWFIFSWVMFAVGAFVNLAFTERFFEKLRMDHLAYGMQFDRKKSYADILETSAFSLENCILVTMTIILMVW